jgi:hypothetical protein
MKPHAGMVVFSSDGRNNEAFAVSQGKQPDLPEVIQFAEKAGGEK